MAVDVTAVHFRNVPPRACQPPATAEPRPESLRKPSDAGRSSWPSGSFDEGKAARRGHPQPAAAQRHRDASARPLVDELLTFSAWRSASEEAAHSTSKPSRADRRTRHHETRLRLRGRHSELPVGKPRRRKLVAGEIPGRRSVHRSQDLRRDRMIFNDARVATQRSSGNRSRRP
jgi:hypothetical protein